MSAEPEVGVRTGGLLADMVRLFLSPGTLFAHLPVVNRCGGALLILIMALFAIARYVGTRSARRLGRRP